MVKKSATATAKVFLIYFKNRSPHLRNRLVEMNLGLARRVAHSAAKKVKEPYEDLEQVAFLGLIAAVEGYDPTAGFAFSSYAVPKIEGKIKQYIRDKGATIRIPQNLQDLYIKKRKVEAKLQLELGRLPTTKELMDALGVSAEDLRASAAAQRSRHLRSLSTRVGFDHTLLTLEDVLEDSRVPQHVVVSDRLGNKLPDLEDPAGQLFIESAFFGKQGVTGICRKQLRQAVEQYAAATSV